MGGVKATNGPSDNIRYVITNIGEYGLRTLTLACQGRYTYATADEAKEAMALYEPDLRAKVLGDRADTLRVCACACWPGHNDPQGIYFDDADVRP